MTEIRWAKLEDARDLGLVHSESYRNAYKGVLPDEFLNQYTPISRERYFYNSLIQGTEHIAITLVNNKAVGCLMLKACSDNDLQKFSGEISAIYLLQNFRAIGLGSQLLNWGLERLKDLGYSTAVLWVLKENKNAIMFYEKQGFMRDGTERIILRGRELSQIRYQKELLY
ncbi:GNAT family N-acetyltransferase [Paenibacillus sp. LHD-38]|uniref:GNAT family N-acetyltransferase n=1 Tax=Paenibacillus sp. LHD-38 TaxID=3072143 RepID=UPI00280E77FB|nr:GNAT family N-acetyltransferase [Paenibacillus sp. LHD-38]MDQ8735873.1 GNAT family N-acetyltransferase [Paenibacillus sp. LHD-38]